MDILTILIISISGIIVGSLITGTILKKSMERKRDLLLKEAMEKAEVMKKEKILQAKEKFLQLKAEHEKFIHEKNDEVQKSENRLKQKEASINLKFEELQKKQKEVATIKQGLQNQVDIVTKKQTDLDKAQKVQIEKLEAIASLSANEAKAQLIENLKEEAKSEALVHVKDIIDEAIRTGSFAAVDSSKVARSLYLAVMGAFFTYFSVDVDFDLTEQHDFELNNILNSLQKK